MAAVVLTLVIAFMVGGVIWLVAGSRLKLAEDAPRNEVLNLVALIGLILPFAFLVVFFWLELA